MKTSKVGIDLIKSFEVLHDDDLKLIGLQPKMDPIGIWTEGYGHAMRDSKGNFIKGAANKALAYKRAKISTEAEAIELLKTDLEVYELIVIKSVKKSLTQNQFDALVSHTYNTGGSSTLFNYINKSASPEVIKKLIETKYITAGGKKLNGLIKRRKAEADLYFSK